MIHLIDLCSLQGDVDWVKVKAAGIDGAYIKSSQYSSTWDHRFGRYAEDAAKAGLAVGAYHFAYCGSSPIDQARFFAKASDLVGRAEGELPPMLDLEFAKDIPAQSIVQWGELFMREAEMLWYPNNASRILSGKPPRLPGLYTYPYFASTLQPFLGQSSLGKYPLWMAGGPHYTDARKSGWVPDENYTGPKPPAPWTKVTINQYSGNGGMPVPGIAVDCDRDLFFGSSADWDQFRGIDRPVDVIEGPAAVTEVPSGG